MQRIIIALTLTCFLFPLQASNRIVLIDHFVPYTISASPDDKLVAIKSWRYVESGTETRLEIKALNGETILTKSGPSGSFSTARWVDSNKLKWIDTKSKKPEVKQFEASKGVTSIQTLDVKFRTAKWSNDGNYLLISNSIKNKSKEEPFFYANKRDNSENTIKLLDGRSFKTIFEYSTNNAIGDFNLSPNNEKISTIEYPDGLSYKSQVFTVDIASSEKSVVLKKTGNHLELFWADDDHLVISTQLDKEISNTPTDLYKININTKKVTNLTADIDNFVDVKSFNGRSFLTAVEERLERNIYRVSLDAMTKKINVNLPTINYAVQNVSEKCLFYIAEKYGLLNEVFARCNGKEPIQITNTSKIVEGVKIGSQRVVSWKSTDGKKIEGLITLPPNYDANKKYPLVVAIHGGPRAMDRQTMKDFSYPTLNLNQNGAIIFHPQFRGGKGYGDEFIKAHYRQAGLLDRLDVVSGIKFISDEFSIDDSNIVLLGWSYGGFLAASLLAHNDIEYKGVVVIAGIVDWQLHYTHEAGKHTTRDFSFGATPWVEPELYRKSSPITFIKNAKAPTLIIHGAKDPICTIASAYTLNQALLDLNVESELIVYPNMGHGPGNYSEWKNIRNQIESWISGKIF